MKKYHIEKNTVQETLIIPLFGRLVCSVHFPDLFSDPEARRICAGRSQPICRSTPGPPRSTWAAAWTTPSAGVTTASAAATTSTCRT